VRCGNGYRDVTTHAQLRHKKINEGTEGLLLRLGKIQKKVREKKAPEKPGEGHFGGGRFAVGGE
jgi:hypothetical protein